MKYDELSSEQKNHLIATRVMNWHPTSCDEVELTVYDSGDACCSNCGVYEHISSFEHGEPQPPHYSENMAIAWQVLKKMCEKLEWTEHMMLFINYLDGSGVVDRNATRLEPIFTLSQLVSWTPDWICRSALMAMSVIDEEGNVVEYGRVDREN